MQATDYKTWIKNVFDHSAPHYDEVEIGSDYFSKLGQALVNFGCPASGSTVLDVATGKGAVLFALAEKLAGHGRIYGIDLSTEMIKATQAIASKKYNNVQLQAMDAEQLTFADHSFDALFCAFAIFFFPNPSKALKEFNRTLKQNGSLYFSLWDDDTDLDAIFQSNLAKLGVTQKIIANNLHADSAEFRQTIVDIGFSFVRAEKFAFTHTYKNAEQWWNSLWSHAFRGHLEQLTPDQLIQLKQATFAELSKHTDKHNRPVEKVSAVFIEFRKIHP